MKLSRVWSLMLASFVAFAASRCAASAIEWSRQLGTSGREDGNAVSVDGLGSAYFAGSTQGILASPAPGRLDIFVARYNSSGSRDWLRQIGTDGVDTAYGVSADQAGNVYVSGDTDRSFFGTLSGSGDATLIKLDSAGNLIWGRQFGSNREEAGYAVSADALGNAYVTGWTGGSLGGPSFGDYDAYITKFDSAGSLLWSRQFGTPGSDQGFGVSADAFGNVYMTGVMTDYYGTVPNLYADQDAFLAKYDSAGNLQWSRELGIHDTGYYAGDEGNSVVADAFGNVYIGGETNNDLAGTNAGGADVFVSKYDSAGNLLWTRQFGTGSNDAATGITADETGNVYMTGFLGAQGLGAKDAFVSKLTPGGDIVWTQLYGTSKDDLGRGIAADALGNVFFVGETQGNLGGINAGGTDAFIAKISTVPEPSTSFLGVTVLVVALIRFNFASQAGRRSPASVWTMPSLQQLSVSPPMLS